MTSAMLLFVLAAAIPTPGEPTVNLYEAASNAAVDWAPAEARELTPGPSKTFRYFGMAVYATKVSDLVSTEYALAGGAHEGNPLVRNRGVRVATGLGMMAFSNWVTDGMRKSGRPKLALAIRVGITVAQSIVTANNFRIGR